MINNLVKISYKLQGQGASSGFTLLEVMVALSILAITFMAVLKSQSISVLRASETKFITSASFLAQKKMAEIEILKIEDIISDSGNFGDDHAGYSWELTVKKPLLNTSENIIDHLKQLDLKILWQDGELYSYKLRQYRFSPEAVR